MCLGLTFRCSLCVCGLAGASGLVRIIVGCYGVGFMCGGLIVVLCLLWILVWVVCLRSYCLLWLRGCLVCACLWSRLLAAFVVDLFWLDVLWFGCVMWILIWCVLVGFRFTLWLGFDDGLCFTDV